MEGVKLNLQIQRGTDFIKNITIVNDNNELTNLDGYIFKFVVKTKNALDKADIEGVINKEIVGSGQSIELHLTSEDTNIEPSIYTYSLKVFFPNGQEHIFAYGDFDIVANATRSV